VLFRSINGFTFGADDPQGVRCPLGAHIRRANPRDGLQPDDPAGRTLANRHRLLRRGRPYTVRDGARITEKGLLFACICSDLERQFEFVQQTWVNAPSFHGLKAEVDPLLGDGAARAFTIPTAAGAVRVTELQRFVTPRAGGYYFLPSRAALAYLASRMRDAAPAAERPAAVKRSRRRPALVPS
jgi:deferrochelatase/peroxidase EfeB